jgi:predicted restriction endonuclease
MNCWPKKLFQKIVTNRISRYALDHKFIRQEQFGFWKKKKKKGKNVSVYIFQLGKFVKEENLKEISLILFFFLIIKKKAYDSIPNF